MNLEHTSTVYSDQCIQTHDIVPRLNSKLYIKYGVYATVRGKQRRSKNRTQNSAHRGARPGRAQRAMTGVYGVKDICWREAERGSWNEGRLGYINCKHCTARHTDARPTEPRLFYTVGLRI